MLKKSISGIRGIINKDFKRIQIVKFARAFSIYTKRSDCIIGHDTRNTHKFVKNAVIEGLGYEGSKIYDLEFASTPEIFRTVKQKRKTGIAITASHNPPEWNGLKFIYRGRGLYETEFSELLKIYNNIKKTSESNLKYSINTINSDYITAIKKEIGDQPLNELKIALDCGGGITSLFIKKIFQNIGCELLVINDKPGVFTRDLDPGTDKLDKLRQEIKDKEYDIGFAFDCDGDRLVIVDKNGNKLLPDHTLILALLYMIENYRIKNIAVSIDTSILIQKIADKNNIKLHYTKVGESNVIKKIEEKKCDFGGEGSSGGVIIPKFVSCRDGVLAACLISKFLSKIDLTKITNNFLNSYQIRRKINFPINLFSLITESIAKEKKCELIDGVKIWESKNSWVLIRPSNTENILRLSVESQNKSEADRLANIYTDMINQIQQ